MIVMLFEQIEREIIMRERVKKITHQITANHTKRKREDFRWLDPSQVRFGGEKLLFRS